jgi:hypothetical protein
MDTNRALKSTLDKKLPISLAEIEPIIDRIHKRYPYINKIEVVLIIRSFFERIRFILMQGDTLSINDFVGKMCFIFFSRTRYGKQFKVVKAKISTPKKMKI